MKKTSKIIKVFVLILLVIACISAYLVHRMYPIDVIAKLKNDKTTYLTSATISGFYEGEPRSVSLKVPETLRYLTEALRDSKTNLGSGSSYFIKLQLNNGAEADLNIFDPRDGKSLSIVVERPFPSDAEFYSIELVDPIPKELSEALHKMENK